MNEWVFMYCMCKKSLYIVEHIQGGLFTTFCLYNETRVSIILEIDYQRFASFWFHTF